MSHLSHVLLSLLLRQSSSLRTSSLTNLTYIHDTITRLHCSLNLPVFLNLRATLRAAFPSLAALSDAQHLLLLAYVTLPSQHPANPWLQKQLATHVIDLYCDTHRMEGHPDHDGSKMEDEWLTWHRGPDGFDSYRDEEGILNRSRFSFGKFHGGYERVEGDIQGLMPILPIDDEVREFMRKKIALVYQFICE